MPRKYRTFKATNIERLRDLETARVYLEVAIEAYETDGDKKAFLRSLRYVAEAQGCIGKLAEKTVLSRQHPIQGLPK